MKSKAEMTISDLRAVMSKSRQFNKGEEESIIELIRFLKRTPIPCEVNWGIRNQRELFEAWSYLADLNEMLRMKHGTHYSPAFCWQMSDLESTYESFMRKYISKRADKAFVGSSNLKVTAFGSCFAREIISEINNLGFDGYVYEHGEQYNNPVVMEEIVAMDYRFSDQGYIANPRNPVQHRIVDTWRNLHNILEDDSRDKNLENNSGEFMERVRGSNAVIMTIGSSQVLYDMEGLCPYYSRKINNKYAHKQMTVAEIKRSIGSMMDRLYAINSEALYVLTVSPISGTGYKSFGNGVSYFENWSSVESDFASKSSLRAAINELINEGAIRNKCMYYPSYEIVMSLAPRCSEISEIWKDPRHLAKPIIEFITKTFSRDVLGSPNA